jgi:hypothetical protein
MRLLFERDLTPHPQYAAFYKWLQNDLQVCFPSPAATRGMFGLASVCTRPAGYPTHPWYATSGREGRSTYPHRGCAG